MTGLLTEHEHEVVDLLGKAASLYAVTVVGSASTRERDIAEFCAGIHILQHAVMAQAAARAYPELYRLAGETLHEKGH